ncbi:MAG: hypothetical protein QGF00_05860, partial [Planctomycetota bacterium]|nr:hypothetical protein [Planctomycetota bacterium]
IDPVCFADSGKFGQRMSDFHELTDAKHIETYWEHFGANLVADALNNLLDAKEIRRGTGFILGCGKRLT